MKIAGRIPAALSAALAFPAICCAATYTVTDLGTLGGAGSSGLGINASGQVTGASDTTGDTESHAFLWTPTTPNGTSGTMHDLRTLGGTQAEGVSINASGQVTGYSLTSGNSQHAFLYDGAMHDLGTSGERSSQGNGINASGHLVGASWDGATNRAFLYDGTRHYLDLSGGTSNSAVAINVSGQVAGSTGLDAFLWTPTTPNGVTGTSILLGSLGGFETTANGLNDSGHVTGESRGASFSSNHAFLYDGTMHDLGTLGGGYSNGYGINASDQITGESSTPGDAATHAFLYTPGSGMVDLNSLIDPLLGWNLGIGQAINDVGQITGYGYHGDDGQLHAFLLTPVPEPSSLILTVASLGAFFALARHKTAGGVERCS
jgi:probable HAF family extracellular repeat protein